MRTLLLLVVSSLLILPLSSGCSGDGRYSPDALGPTVDFICPGDPSGTCDFSNDNELRVGAAAVDITPEGYETWVDQDGNGEFSSAIDTFLDCGLDRLCPDDEGYVGPDEGEANGLFDALWLAGFGNSRPMQGVADAIWARATVLEQGNTRIGIVSVDLIGWFYDEVLTVRAVAKETLGLDHVIVSATHVHEAPDTMGQWGPNIARSGVNPAFVAQIHSGVQQALREAQESQRPAEVHGGSYSIAASAWSGTGVNNINQDKRDPNITDETIWTARFTVAGTTETIATWINFPNHPEASGDKNVLLSADFAHTLRTTVEEGAAAGPDGPQDGLGGVAIYFQGACGGMMTPLSIDVEDLDGTIHSGNTLEKAYAVGRVTGYHALQAVAADALDPSPELSVRTKQLFVPVQNTGFHVLLNAGIFARQGYNYNSEELIGPWNRPDLKTEVSLFQVGGVSSITIPGELLPELAIGGYDGSHTGPLRPIIEDGSSNPPDLDNAPEGPYLKDLMPGDTRMLFGLGNDEIGYLIPDYNYILHPTSPYLDEAEGDHYEETNSVGELGSRYVVEATEGVLNWAPPE